MTYAVIKLSGQEFKISEGDTLKVNKLESFDPKVLMYSNGSSVLVGNPYLDNIVINGKVEGEEKGKKLKITRFKAKSRYDKTVGYRSTLSVIKILSIKNKTESTSSSPKAEKNEVEKVVAKPKAPSRKSKAQEK